MENLTIAMTTAPREIPTVVASVESCRAAGFTPMLFKEPGCPAWSDDELCNPEPNGYQFEAKQGHYRSWLYAAAWARSQGREFVMVMEDDVIVHPETLKFIRLFAKRGRVLSLFSTKREMEKRGLGVWSVARGDRFAGALALIFHCEDLENLHQHPITVEWPKTRNCLVQNCDWVDHMVGRWAEAEDIEICEPNPSICDHIGVTNTLGHGAYTDQRKAHILLPADQSLPWQSENEVTGMFSSFVQSSCCGNKALLRVGKLTFTTDPANVPQTAKRGETITVPIE